MYLYAVLFFGGRCSTVLVGSIHASIRAACVFFLFIMIDYKNNSRSILNYIVVSF